MQQKAVYYSASSLYMKLVTKFSSKQFHVLYTRKINTATG